MLESMRSPSIPLLEYLRVNSLRETEVQGQLREKTNLLPEFNQRSTQKSHSYT